MEWPNFADSVDWLLDTRASPCNTAIADNNWQLERAVTEDQAIELITRLICRSRHIDSSQVLTAENLTEDLGFDSLDAAELLAALHKETGCQLELDSISDMNTVTGIARSLTSVSVSGSE